MINGGPVTVEPRILVSSLALALLKSPSRCNNGLGSSSRAKKRSAMPFSSGVSYFGSVRLSLRVDSYQSFANAV